MNFDFFFLTKFIIKGNRTHLAQKNSQPVSKNNTIFRLSQKCIKRLIIKTFLKNLLCFEHQNHATYLKFCSKQ